MAWVITRLCDDCQDTACVEHCPVDCIFGLKTPDPRYRRQLFIDPALCIDCAACEPVCPWKAAVRDTKLPEKLREDAALNARVFQDHPKEAFTTKPAPLKRKPTPEEVAANEKKWL